MVLAFLPLALSLTILHVYPDPLLAENGGEAIQLVNPTDRPLPTAAMVLATKSGSYALPATTIPPGGGFLVADTGWSGPQGLRDNLSWPDADEEIGLSLANTDGWVELRDTTNGTGNGSYGNGSYTVVSRVAWNGTAGVGKPHEGFVWNGSMEYEPYFLNSSQQLVRAPVTLTVVASAPRITGIDLPDEGADGGVQLYGYARTVSFTLTAAYLPGVPLSVDARFAGHDVELVPLPRNASQPDDGTQAYQGTLALDGLPAGSYTLDASASADAMTTHESVAIRILPASTIRTDPLAFVGEAGDHPSAVLTVHNDGSVSRTVRVVSAPDELSCERASHTIPPGDTAAFACNATLPLVEPGNETLAATLLVG